MIPRPHRPGRLVIGPLLGAIGATTAQAASGELPMSYLRTFGPKADPATPLTWALLAISCLVVIIIGTLVVLGAMRRRMASPIVPGERLPVARTGSGLLWITVGTALTTVVLLGCVIWTVTTMAAIDAPPSRPDLTIEVTGHQWWWELRYLGQDPQQTFVTANEIHIPVGRPVRFQLAASDVIHSFWIPSLGGKTDLIPGQTNITWLQADKPGVYRGQCGEYCGEQHAHMALQVVADTPEDFDRWRQAQLQPAAPVDDSLRAARDSFVVHCGVCHSVRGTPAGGRMGPDLSHLMGRRTLAAGTVPNVESHLDAWIADPQAIKPGARMPDLDLTGAQLADIGRFLQTLN